MPVMLILRARGRPGHQQSTPPSPVGHSERAVVPDMASSTDPADSSNIAPPAHGAVWTLRLLLIGMIAIPPLLAAIGGYLSYRANDQHATAALAEAVVVAEENTTKVLDTHMLVAARTG